jgi:glutamate dehydrogenase (NAD(P)+)
MEKRFRENKNMHILMQLEELTGRQVSAEERAAIMRGADEIDLVHSGLEETMISATREIMDIWNANPTIPDMRTAAYVNAINKVANSYMELGIFP